MFSNKQFLFPSTHYQNTYLCLMFFLQYSGYHSGSVATNLLLSIQFSISVAINAKAEIQPKRTRQNIF